MSFEPKSSYSKEDLIQCGDAALFAPEDGKLPRGEMLMMDRIITINSDGGPHGKGEMVAELDIRPDLWFFDRHFKIDHHLAHHTIGRSCPRMNNRVARSATKRRRAIRLRTSSPLKNGPAT